MTPRRTSLLQSLFKSLLIPGAIVGIVGVSIVYHLFKEEYDELQDVSLINQAHLILTFLEAAPDGLDIANLLAFENAMYQPDEMTFFWVVDRAGRVIAASTGAQARLVPQTLEPGLSTAQGHRFATVRSATNKDATVILAAPMAERNEALLDVLAGVVFGFLLLGGLGAIAAYWAVRRSTGIIASLSSNIAAKDAHNLSPIDRTQSFTEIEPVIDTLDRLMARLDTALAAERAFATNAAHELRTPVAICLAHIQRLKARQSDDGIEANAIEIEQGLKRLMRLIERLLQMSRAESGLGLSPTEMDIRPVISLLLKEMRDREPSHDRLVIHPPTGIWPSRVDPDALGIILNNIFENALKYRQGDAPIVVDARQAHRVVVSNDCAPLTPDELARIKLRGGRKGARAEGFGLGLSIVQALCAQSGCRFDLISPQVGQTRGFTVVLTLPNPPDPA